MTTISSTWPKVWMAQVKCGKYHWCWRSQETERLGCGGSVMLWTQQESWVGGEYGGGTWSSGNYSNNGMGRRGIITLNGLIWWPEGHDLCVLSQPYGWRALAPRAVATLCHLTKSFTCHPPRCLVHLSVFKQTYHFWFPECAGRFFSYFNFSIYVLRIQWKYDMKFKLP